jgi:hypothetical protein
LEKERHSFSPQTLKIDDLHNIINQHPHQQRLEQIPRDGRRMLADELNKYHFINYGSAVEFIEHGFGYCVKIDEEVAAACTSALVCEQGGGDKYYYETRIPKNGFSIFSGLKVFDSLPTK